MAKRESWSETKGRTIDEGIEDLPMQPGDYAPAFRLKEQYADMEPDRLLPSGRAPWSVNAEASLRWLKQMIGQAVELVVPHWKGALAGTHPIIIIPDGPKYGVEGGIFQAGQ